MIDFAVYEGPCGVVCCARRRGLLEPALADMGGVCSCARESELYESDGCSEERGGRLSAHRVFVRCSLVIMGNSVKREIAWSDGE